MKSYDIYLLEMESMGKSYDGRAYIITGMWNSKAPMFWHLMKKLQKINEYMWLWQRYGGHGGSGGYLFPAETAVHVYPAKECLRHFRRNPFTSSQGWNNLREKAVPMQEIHEVLGRHCKSEKEEPIIPVSG